MFTPVYVRFALLAWLVPCAAVAQTTSDGVNALIAGDTATAVRILRPLAEGRGEPDPVAQFFLATLYESGLGVPRDPTHACGLFLAAAKPSNPFMVQSAEFAAETHRDIPFIRDLCEKAIPSGDASTMSVPRPPNGLQSSVAAPGPAIGTAPPSSTAIGIDRYLRGDYGGAAEILKPIAEAHAPRDRAAELFMALLYTNGQGVPADPIRGCALNLRVSIGPGADQMSLLDRLGSRLRSHFRDSMTIDQLEHCTALSNAGFDNRFDPVTFTLEPGYWISLDLLGAAISDEGKETRIKWNLGDPGAMFLTIRHTELPIPGGTPPRRHFIEAVMWRPNRAGDQWTLIWRATEVVRGRLETVTSQELLTVSAPRPPDIPPVDAGKGTQLHVNDRGDAEWIVTDGNARRSGIIESEAQREERAARTRAKQAEEARINWGLVLDTHRAPALMYSDAAGCLGLFLYGWSPDRTEVLTAEIDERLFQPPATTQAFSAAIQAGTVRVTLHVYERPVRSWPFCTDLGQPPLPEEVWKATVGTVTIQMLPPDPRAEEPRATITLTGAEFVAANGSKIKQSQPIILTAVIGGVSG